MHQNDPERKTAGLSKAQRLTKRTEFDSVIQESDIRLTRYPVRLAAKANNFKFGRLGLNVPKRYIRLAVDRNRVKRLLREWFRVNGEHFRSFDVFLSVEVYERPGDQIKAALAKMLEAWDKRVSALEKEY